MHHDVTTRNMLLIDVTNVKRSRVDHIMPNTTGRNWVIDKRCGRPVDRFYGITIDELEAE